ncbi:MAG TPA: hypothetical protein VHW23_02385 [Kofleriaceae bacterium]|nr:hypothetical protein [Kofleriaceae bacterium]
MIAVALLVPASLVLPGCPFECGAYSGGGDQMYRRGDDVLFLCGIGGFTLTLGGQVSTGRYDETTSGFVAADGETGARAFSFQTGAGSASSPELGAGWTEVVLDKTALDHADVQCTGLQSQAWWTTSEDDALPAMTAFHKPVRGFATTADCQAAQHAGTYPATARCEDTVLLCPNRQLVRTTAGGVETGSYSTLIGEIAASSPAGEIDGVFAADGTLRSGNDLWQQVPLGEADPAVVDAGCGAGA